MRVEQLKEIACTLHNITLDDVEDVLIYLAPQEFVKVR
jgi:hypothetical protein